MYLSRVEIDVKNRFKIKNLNHLGAYHDWVERSFPSEIKAGIRKRHLWRIDPLGNKKYLLLISEEKPDLAKLEKYGVPGTAQAKSYDHYLQQIKKGGKWRFRLTANPAYRINDGKKSRIVPHVTIGQQAKWLLDRAEKNGFEILQQDVDARNNIDFIKVEKSASGLNTSLQKSDSFTDGRLRFNITDRDWPILHKGKRNVKLSRVSFEGFLEVTDVDKFKSALINGIGREKAYGMGMLTVIPAEK